MWILLQQKVVSASIHAVFFQIITVPVVFCYFFSFSLSFECFSLDFCYHHPHPSPSLLVCLTFLAGSYLVLWSHLLSRQHQENVPKKLNKISTKCNLAISQEFSRTSRKVSAYEFLCRYFSYIFPLWVTTWKHQIYIW